MGIVKKILTYIKFSRKKFGFIGKNSDFFHLNSKYIKPENIYIGNFCKISEEAYLDGSGGIEIKDCTIIGPKITIITSNHNYNEKTISFLPYDNKMIRKKVTIKEYCWIGRNVIIVPGVTIGKACVIAAGSVVTRDIEDYSIVGGNPAKIIKKRDKNLTDKLIKENRCVSNPNINPKPKKVWI